VKPHLRVSTSACRVLAPSSLKSFASTCAFSVRVCVCVCACVCVCVCVCTQTVPRAQRECVHTHAPCTHTCTTTLSLAHLPSSTQGQSNTPRHSTSACPSWYRAHTGCSQHPLEAPAPRRPHRLRGSPCAQVHPYLQKFRETRHTCIIRIWINTLLTGQYDRLDLLFVIYIYPVAPGGPCLPCLPLTPSYAAGPGLPIIPMAPGAPLGPFLPSLPSSPRLPSRPRRPRGPGGPACSSSVRVCVFACCVYMRGAAWSVHDCSRSQKPRRL